jgi:predicted nuclease of predicted toxin-antitoxin system
MRIYADECVFRVTTETLRQSGHDVVTAQELHMGGHEDDAVIMAATGDNRIFLTNDMHFSNIVAYPPSKYAGIIVLRIRPRNQARVHSNLLRFLGNKEASALAGSLVIIDQNKWRIRHR